MLTRVLIADDLTGAMDTGVFLAQRYKKVNVVFDSLFIEELSGKSDALIIDTESRNIPMEDAYRKVKNYLEKIESIGAELLYKKIDSTLRGNIGRELEAALSPGIYDMAAVVPALPLLGRTTIHGIHYISGVPLADTDIAADPFSQVLSSYIPEILKEQTSLKTAVIEIRDIKKGSENISAILKLLRKNGCKLVIFDVQEDKDLINIYKAIKSSEIKILPCGSAGLFSKMFSDVPMVENCTKRARRKPDKPAVVISGSPAKVSKKQIEYARQQGELVITVSDSEIISTAENAVKEINRVKTLALDALLRGRNIIIDFAGAGKSELSEKYEENPEKLLKASSEIQKAIACIVNEIAETAEISGMLVFGGDTALSICRALGTKAISIIGEVEPLVPYAAFEGGTLDGGFIATKAGGFGSEDVIQKTVKLFRKFE